MKQDGGATENQDNKVEDAGRCQSDTKGKNGSTNPIITN